MSGAELRDQLGENWCLTVLRSDHALCRDLMTARLGTVVTEPVPWDRSMDRFLDTDWEAEPLRVYYLLAPMDPVGRTWVVVEPYGVQATRPVVQAALSQQATTFTLMTNENAFEYFTGALGNVTARTDLALEDPADGDRLVRALARLQEDSGVVLDKTWWNGRQWLVHSEPVPQPAPSSTAAVAPERLALILEALSAAAHQVGLDERADVVTALDAMVQIGQLDPSRRSGRAKLVKRARKALTTLGYALWNPYTGSATSGVSRGARDDRARRGWRTTRRGASCSSVRHCSAPSTCTRDRAAPARRKSSSTSGTPFLTPGRRCGRTDSTARRRQCRPANSAARGAASCACADRIRPSPGASLWSTGARRLR